MAAAGGIQNAFISLAARTYRFNPSGTTSTDIGNVMVSGAWVADGNSGTVMVWDGNDPSITKSTTGDTSVGALQVGWNTAEAGDLIVNIDHDPVTLNEGDTIIYTSVKISFETPNL